ncbi:hypothetical protein AJ79_06677 [Helicocarpus griseus UAMH5409]|uniref:Alcohol acetyltransferase n=1 Tax=Helicocarpus griseus UAMH5409 TaxID=1447875 RepID=A0A2B7XBH0_9EURO|nr:hypothetical protein AJ79_06677 [Helicocarpus griseus UAMH5409]
MDGLQFYGEDNVLGFEKLRPVGRSERYSTTRHYLKFYLNVAVTATYTLPATCSQPTKSYIYRACTMLIAQHPILSAVPVGEDTNQPYFARLPTISLDKTVFFTERQHGYPNSNIPSSLDPDLDLQEILNIQQNMSFSPPSPFWRLCILTDPNHGNVFTASFVFHHAIGDGLSGMAFHKAFLRALHLISSSPSSCPEVDNLVTAPKIPLLPNVEALHPMPVTIPYLASILFRKKIWNKRDPGLWTGSKIIEPLKNEIRLLALSETQTTLFRDLCRKNKTTLTAALQTTVAGALFRIIPEHYSQVRCVGVLSQRRWLGDSISAKSMGLFVQDLQDTYRRERFFGQNGNYKFPWGEAARSKKTIQATINMKGKNATPNLLRYVSDYHKELFLSKVGKDRASSYEVSNLGVFGTDIEPEAGSPSPRIGRMVFSQSANVTGSAFEVSAITGGDGCLALAFSWQKDVVTTEFISDVMDIVSRHLITADVE